MQGFLEWARQFPIPSVWYHGTNSAFVPSIRKLGLVNPYLTDIMEIAEQFAEAADGDGKPVIIVLSTPDQNFSVDRPSLQEPLGFGGFRSGVIDKRVRGLYRKHPQILNHEWKLSFPVTRTLRYNGTIPPSYVQDVLYVNAKTMAVR